MKQRICWFEFVNFDGTPALVNMEQVIAIGHGRENREHVRVYFAFSPSQPDAIHDPYVVEFADRYEDIRQSLYEDIQRFAALSEAAG